MSFEQASHEGPGQDDERSARSSARAARPSLTVTYSVMTVCLVLFAASWVNPDLAVIYGLTPSLLPEEPWTFVTSAFFHEPRSFAHIGANMFSLWIFGQMLEPLIGRIRLAGLLGAGILSASLGVVLWEDANPYSYTIGLSGGIFALIAGVLMVQIALGQQVGGTLVLLAVNAAMPLLMPNISWQGHLGGFLGGLLFSAAVLWPGIRRRRQEAETRTAAPERELS